MPKVDSSVEPSIEINPLDTHLETQGLTADKVPLDLLQKMAVIAHRSLERRPPKLKLHDTQKQDLEDISIHQIQMKPVLAKETSEIAFQIVTLVLKLQDEVEASNDLGARKGLAAIERVSRMFEHIYQAKSMSQAGL
ncbi:MAG: hypothetical protein AAGF53_02485 [Pseudomonadota bacterium]